MPLTLSSDLPVADTLPLTPYIKLLLFTQLSILFELGHERSPSYTLKHYGIISLQMKHLSHSFPIC